MLIAEKCANRSSPPSSGVMKPKPFASLNHLTVPVAIQHVPHRNEQSEWRTVRHQLPPSRLRSGPERREDRLQVERQTMEFLRALAGRRQASWPSIGSPLEKTVAI